MHPRNLGATVSRDSVNCLLLATRLMVGSGVTCAKTAPPEECFRQGRFLTHPRKRVSGWQKGECNDPRSGVPD